MSISWYYCGPFTSVATNPGFSTFGYPAVGTYNAFGNNRSTPFVSNGASYASGLMANLTTNNVDRSSNTESPVRTNLFTQATGYFLAGGSSAFPLTFGIGLATGLPASSPADITSRFIMMPNSQSTPDGSANPAGIVLSNLFFPAPLNASVANSNIIGTDVMGTNIVDHTVQGLYRSGLNITTYVYPFIMPNAWKFSGSDWYVDTSTPIWWQSASLNSGRESRKHLVTLATSAPNPTLSTFLTVAVTTTSAYGWEDLPFGGTGPEMQQWNDYNDLVISIVSGTWLI